MSTEVTENDLMLVIFFLILAIMTPVQSTVGKLLLVIPTFPVLFIISLSTHIFE